MTLSTYQSKGTAAAATCWFTMIVNGIFATAGAQDYSAFRPDPTAGEPDIHVLQYGMFDVRPSLFGTLTYDDNVLTTSTDQLSDVIAAFSPSVLLGAGDYRQREEALLTFGYTPTFLVYFDHSDLNRIDHDLALEGQSRPGKWTLGLKQQVKILTGSELDAGTLVDRNIYTTDLHVGYEISPKTSVSVGGHLAVNDYDALNSYNEYGGSGFVDYEVSPKLKFGGGMVAGWVDNQTSVDQSFQQLLARSVYSWSEKLDFTGSVGVEFRQFDSNQENDVNPVFSLAATYRPEEKLTLSLEAHRRTLSSVVLVDQNYDNTGISLTARYRFTDRWAFNFGAAYDHNDYESTQDSVNAHRVDDAYNVRFGVDWQVVERCTAGFYYLYRKNDSSGGTSASQFGYSNNQVGVSVAYRF